MRDVHEGLAAHLVAGVTTLCRCWRLERGDGVVMGFTDHDRDLAFDGVIYGAAAGLEAGEAVSAAGFSAGGLEVAGALASDRMTEADLAAGVYDHAEVRVFLVNWSAPAERHLLRVGHVGEVVREDGAFRAELRGLATLLDQPQGRAFRHGCDADVGDARCGVDLTALAYRGTGVVTGVSGRRRFAAGGLSAFASGWFDRGRLTWTGGANAGRSVEVGAHRVAGDVVEIELWLSAAFAVAEGDAFAVTAGCDKLFATCRGKFSNAANFRGFPHMPGNDAALNYARAGDDNDGAAIVA